MHLAKIPKHNLHLFLIPPRCKCGNCSTERLENCHECQCCTEIEGCMHEMHSFEVVEEVGNVQCVTEHPGFEPVCLNKWCLRLSAAKYKTKRGARYRRTGFENR